MNPRKPTLVEKHLVGQAGSRKANPKPPSLFELTYWLVFVMYLLGQNHFHNLYALVAFWEYYFSGKQEAQLLFLAHPLDR